MSNNDKSPKKPARGPQPLDEGGLSRVSGGVGPLGPDELRQLRERVVVDLSRAPDKKKPTR